MVVYHFWSLLHTFRQVDMMFSSFSLSDSNALWQIGVYCGKGHWNAHCASFTFMHKLRDMLTTLVQHTSPLESKFCPRSQCAKVNFASFAAHRCYRGTSALRAVLAWHSSTSSASCFQQSRAEYISHLLLSSFALSGPKQGSSVFRACCDTRVWSQYRSSRYKLFASCASFTFMHKLSYMLIA